ncbi:MAG TPA: nitroreductase family deazaflavin-dependent oxidoreductase [Sporichthyaceae bacterium]|nr:nitroreductase family deazaflavin-dependent oxidoreductase [Sporichthyaceae bacterium]
MGASNAVKDTIAKTFAGLHTALIRRSGGRFGKTFKKAPVLLLTTTGRKSGQPRTSPLLYLRDGQDLAVVASYGGDDRYPAWFHNLTANPEVSAELEGKKVELRASVADAATKARLWPDLLTMYKTYESYQKKTDRELPVVLLSPR